MRTGFAGAGAGTVDPTAFMDRACRAYLRAALPLA
jgi:hypothetical protein